MKENKLLIQIKKPIGEVFEFTTNPDNTPLWIDSISEEVAMPYPPTIGTKYKNHSGDGNWDEYRVIELEKNKIFTLIDNEDNYHVRYSYKELPDDGGTELEYYEWMEEGELNNPFEMKILEKLKDILEKE